MLENFESSSVKRSEELGILLNFLNLSAIFYAVLPEETYFHFELDPDFMQLKFSVNFGNSKFLYALKTHI